MVVPEAITDLFTDAVTVLGALAVGAAALVGAGLAIRKGLNWVRTWGNKA